MKNSQKERDEVKINGDAVLFTLMFNEMSVKEIAESLYSNILKKRERVVLTCPICNKTHSYLEYEKRKLPIIRIKSDSRRKKIRRLKCKDPIKSKEESSRFFIDKAKDIKRISELNFQGKYNLIGNLRHRQIKELLQKGYVQKVTRGNEIKYKVNYQEVFDKSREIKRLKEYEKREHGWLVEDKEFDIEYSLPIFIEMIINEPYIKEVIRKVTERWVWWMGGDTPRPLLLLRELGGFDNLFQMIIEIFGDFRGDFKKLIQEMPATSEETKSNLKKLHKFQICCSSLIILQKTVDSSAFNDWYSEERRTLKKNASS